MKRLTSAAPHAPHATPTLAMTATACALLASPPLAAQARCPGIGVLATGLLNPSKVIQSPRGNFLVAEAGPEVANNGRISLVDQNGNRHTLLDGLPAARTFVGDFNGVTGLWLQGRTLYVLNGQGDVTLAGPAPATERPNPSPSSPIFSSVLAVHFSADMEETTGGVRLTLADHHALKAGELLVRTDARGKRVVIELVADFVDYVAEPRPTFAGNVRHSHPYGIVGRGRSLFISDAGLNSVRTINAGTGEEKTIAQFAPTPNPRPIGPPVLENVPTSIGWDGDLLQVTLFSGGPFFLQGFSSVQHIDPQSGSITPQIIGLTSAMDASPLPSPGSDLGDLTLEFSLSFPAPGPGRLQFVPSSGAPGTILADCLTTPTSMVIDSKSNRVVITELATGRLVTRALP